MYYADIIEPFTRNLERYLAKYLKDYPKSPLFRKPKIYRFETNMNPNRRAFWCRDDKIDRAIVSSGKMIWTPFIRTDNGNEGYYSSASDIIDISKELMPYYWVYAYLHSLESLNGGPARDIADIMHVDHARLHYRVHQLMPCNTARESKVRSHLRYLVLTYQEHGCTNEDLYKLIRMIENDILDLVRQMSIVYFAESEDDDCRMYKGNKLLYKITHDVSGDYIKVDCK